MKFLSWSSLWSFTSACVVVLHLAGCGGESGRNNSAETSPPTQATQNEGPLVRQLTIGIDPGMPITANQSITRLVSDTTSSTVGEPLSVVMPEMGGALVMGLNAQDVPILLGFVKGNESLSIESTAVALVRIALGVTHRSKQADIADQVIRQATTFQILAEGVRSEASSGRNASESQVILDLVWQVARETGSTLAAASTASGAVQTAQTRILVERLPHDMYPQSPFTEERLWVTDAPANDVTVNNLTRLHWEATTWKSAISQLAVANIEPMKSTFWQNFGLYGGSETSVNIGGASDRFQLKVGQTDATGRINSTALLMQGALTLADLAIIKTGLSDDVTTTCAKLIAEAVVNEKLPVLLEKPSGEEVIEYLKAIFPELSLVDWNDVLKQCHPAGKDISDVLEIFFKNAGRLVTAVQFTNTFYATGSLAYQLVEHWKKTYDIDMCQSSDGLVAPCPDDPAPIVGPVLPTESQGSSSGAFSVSIIDRKTCKTETRSGVGGKPINYTGCVFTSFAAIACAGCGDDPRLRVQNYSVRLERTDTIDIKEGGCGTTTSHSTPYNPNLAVFFDSTRGEYTRQAGTYTGAYRMTGALTERMCTLSGSIVTFNFIVLDTRTKAEQKLSATIVMMP